MEGMAGKGPLKMNWTHQRFAKCLSAVIAKLMQEQGRETVYEVMRLIPGGYKIAPMTVYSTIYGRCRPNLWVCYHVAGALGVTCDWLCTQAVRLMDSGEKVKTVRDLFGDTGKGGRGKKKKRRRA